MTWSSETLPADDVDHASGADGGDLGIGRDRGHAEQGHGDGGDASDEAHEQTPATKDGGYCRAALAPIKKQNARLRARLIADDGLNCLVPVLRGCLYIQFWAMIAAQ